MNYILKDLFSLNNFDNLDFILYVLKIITCNFNQRYIKTEIISEINIICQESNLHSLKKKQRKLSY